MKESYQELKISKNQDFKLGAERYLFSIANTGGVFLL